MDISLDLAAAIKARANLDYCVSTRTLYLPVPHASLSIRITPPLPSDPPAQSATLNDPAVAFNLVGPPYPYSLDAAASWNALCLAKTTAIVDAWKEGLWEPPDGCPVGNLRDAESGAWFGDIGIARWKFEDLHGEDKRRAVEENEARKLGDPELVWSVGYFVNPHYQGQGIASAALHTLLHSYMIPVLNAHHVRSSAYVGNIGSKRVQEKNGFREIGRFWTPVAEARGGGEKEQWMMEWRRG